MTITFRAFTVDVGSVLGDYTGPSPAKVLADLAQAPANAAEIDRQVLSKAPRLTDEILEMICDELLIDPALWPDTFPGGFEPYPGAVEALTRLADHAPVAALLNLSLLGGSARITALDDHCGPGLDAVCASYEIGFRKPNRHCWTRAATQLRVATAELIHFGDRVPEDILGALNAGCAAAIFTNTRDVTIPEDLDEDPRVYHVPDFASGVDLVADLVIRGEFTRAA